MTNALGYTERPVKARVFQEDDLVRDTVQHVWAIDGADGLGNYTEDIWYFRSYREAVAALPRFWAEIIAPRKAYQRWMDHDPDLLASFYPSDVEWDQLPAEVRDLLDPGSAHACVGEGCTHSDHGS